MNWKKEQIKMFINILFRQNGFGVEESNAVWIDIVAGVLILIEERSLFNSIWENSVTAIPIVVDDANQKKLLTPEAYEAVWTELQSTLSQ